MLFTVFTQMAKIYIDMYMMKYKSWETVVSTMLHVQTLHSEIYDYLILWRSCNKKFWSASFNLGILLPFFSQICVCSRIFLSSCFNWSWIALKVVENIALKKKKRAFVGRMVTKSLITSSYGVTVRLLVQHQWW